MTDHTGENPRHLQSASKIAAEDVIDTMSTAVLVLDSNMQLGYMNPAAEALFGTSAVRTLGQPIDHLLYDDGTTVFNDLEKIYSSGLTLTQRAAQFKTRPGQEVTADLTISLDPVAERLVIELQPISRLVRINRDDRAMSSMKTTRELIRGLAHEVKNPLGGLRGAAQLLERELDNPAHAEYTRIIIDEADRLTELVDRLLGPNREPTLSMFNIHHALERVVSLVDAEFPGQLAFERDYDPSLPELFGDEDQIIQALLNMVRNATQVLADHPDNPDPKITLRTRVVRTFTIESVMHRIVARIDIADNGPGIESDMIDRIFYPMISGRSDGTGLGLAITQSVIGQHGGVIECESRPGMTCFSAFLPLPQDPLLQDHTESDKSTDGIDNND